MFSTSESRSSSSSARGSNTRGRGGPHRGRGSRGSRTTTYTPRDSPSTVPSSSSRGKASSRPTTSTTTTAATSSSNPSRARGRGRGRGVYRPGGFRGETTEPSAESASSNRGGTTRGRGRGGYQESRQTQDITTSTNRGKRGGFKQSRQTQEPAVERNVPPKTRGTKPYRGKPTAKPASSSSYSQFDQQPQYSQHAKPRGTGKFTSHKIPPPQSEYEPSAFSSFVQSTPYELNEENLFNLPAGFSGFGSYFSEPSPKIAESPKEKLQKEVRTSTYEKEEEEYFDEQEQEEGEYEEGEFEENEEEDEEEAEEEGEFENFNIIVDDKGDKSLVTSPVSVNKQIVENIYKKSPEKQIVEKQKEQPTQRSKEVEVAYKKLKASFLQRQPNLEQESLNQLDYSEKIREKIWSRKYPVDTKHLVGTCYKMCSDEEVNNREKERRLSVFETASRRLVDERGHEYAKAEPSLCVKAYQRAAAGTVPVASQVRPPHILRKSLDYLINEILDRDDASYHEVFLFIRDRARAVAQDLTVQHIRDERSVDLHEIIARFHIMSHHLLAEEEDFDAHQNLKLLNNYLKSLQEFYSELRMSGISCPNESEFTCYFILNRLSSDQEVMRCLKSLPNDILNSPEVNFAIKVFDAFSTNNYSRFFKLVDEATYLNACIMHIYFPTVRKSALQTMNRTLNAKTKNSFEGAIDDFPKYPISKLEHILLFDSFDECIHYCNCFGITTLDDSVLFKYTTFTEPSKIAKTKSLFIEKKVYRIKRSTLALVNFRKPPKPHETPPVPIPPEQQVQPIPSSPLRPIQPIPPSVTIPPQPSVITPPAITPHDNKITTPPISSHLIPTPPEKTLNIVIPPAEPQPPKQVTPSFPKSPKAHKFPSHPKTPTIIPPPIVQPPIAVQLPEEVVKPREQPSILFTPPPPAEPQPPIVTPPIVIPPQKTEEEINREKLRKYFDAWKQYTEQKKLLRQKRQIHIEKSHRYVKNNFDAMVLDNVAMLDSHAEEIRSHLIDQLYKRVDLGFIVFNSNVTNQYKIFSDFFWKLVLIVDDINDPLQAWTVQKLLSDSSKIHDPYEPIITLSKFKVEGNDILSDELTELDPKKKRSSLHICVKQFNTSVSFEKSTFPFKGTSSIIYALHTVTENINIDKYWAIEESRMNKHIVSFFSKMESPRIPILVLFEKENFLQHGVSEDQVQIRVHQILNKHSSSVFSHIMCQSMDISNISNNISEDNVRKLNRTFVDMLSKLANTSPQPPIVHKYSIRELLEECSQNHITELLQELAEEDRHSIPLEDFILTYNYENWNTDENAILQKELLGHLSLPIIDTTTDFYSDDNCDLEILAKNCLNYIQVLRKRRGLSPIDSFDPINVADIATDFADGNYSHATFKLFELFLKIHLDMLFDADPLYGFLFTRTRFEKIEKDIMKILKQSGNSFLEGLALADEGKSYYSAIPQDEIPKVIRLDVKPLEEPKKRAKEHTETKQETKKRKTFTYVNMEDSMKDYDKLLQAIDRQKSIYENMENGINVMEDDLIATSSTEDDWNSSISTYSNYTSESSDLKESLALLQQRINACSELISKSLKP
ncbi:hypothetical protein C9374_002733 [Naegleria lovaniensis]|uniref:SAC3/GANP/THP3 conserved domain-containing protein n=1 Tax=Naegleria lovaniensis TaxID=51637 RepID=A0AA88GP68_NAELO|nr:uncharacterized protein C9374_002733 [Naegleria lovaniensis]KAG2386287.1 hypothetical protein C9374_002733 [Naegleria lovaniensis]